jgi:excisionase family DNA binding protein
MDKAPAAIPKRLLYSPAEAETLLGVSHSTLYRLTRSGRLQIKKIGSRSAITAEAIEQFIAGLPSAGDAP